MKNLKIITALLAALSMMFVVSVTQATTFQFENITNNGLVDLTGAGQITVDVTEVGGGVAFIFENDVGFDSSITSIYFDSGTNTDLFSNFSISSTVGEVVFALSTRDPNDPNYPNVPAGNTISFDADVAADSPGSPKYGVDATGESITFLAALGSNYTNFDDFIKIMLVGSFRAGIHLTSIDGACVGITTLPDGRDCSDSDSYVTVNPVPVPAAAWLFGTALFGFFATSRRKKIS